MIDMTWTKQDLKNIDEALATGATSVTMQGRTVVYRSLTEMMRLRNLIASSLHDSNRKTAPRVIKTTTDRGYQ